MLTNGPGEPRAFHRDVSHQVGRLVQAGQRIECPFCDATHLLEATINPKTKQKDSRVMVYWCSGMRYLGAVGGVCMVGAKEAKIDLENSR
jgi:hypothetical protein